MKTGTGGPKHHRKQKPRVKRPEHFRYCVDCGSPSTCRCGDREDHVDGACAECLAETEEE